MASIFLLVRLCAPCIRAASGCKRHALIWQLGRPGAHARRPRGAQLAGTRPHVQQRLPGSRARGRAHPRHAAGPARAAAPSAGRAARAGSACPGARAPARPGARPSARPAARGGRAAVDTHMSPVLQHAPHCKPWGGALHSACPALACTKSSQLAALPGQTHHACSPNKGCPRRPHEPRERTALGQQPGARRGARLRAGDDEVAHHCVCLRPLHLVLPRHAAQARPRRRVVPGLGLQPSPEQQNGL